jgi:hypothetical protein
MCYKNSPFFYVETSWTREDMSNDNASKFDLSIGEEPNIVIRTPPTQSPSGSRSASAVSPPMASTNFMQVSDASSENPVVVEDSQHGTTFGRRAPARTALALQVLL